MERTTLSKAAALALLAATAATTWASGHETLPRDRAMLPGTATALSPAASAPKVFTTVDRLDELGGRLSQQATVLDRTLERTRYLVTVLVLLIGGCIAYLWVRLAQLAGKCGRLEAGVEATPAVICTEPPAGTATSQPAAGSSRPKVAPVPRERPAARIPRVTFLSGVIDRLVAGINESRRRRSNVETGYALVGKIIGEGSSRSFVVNGTIDEGPDAARSGGHHKADRDYQQRELELLQLVDGEAMHVGDAHLHPGNLDRCSGGDLRTDTGNVRDSCSQEMVFVIATASSAHWSGRSTRSLYRGGLKLDFYYLGKASNYEYRHFRPEVVEGPALSVPVALRRFAAVDPIRACLDFDNLRRLTAYRMTVGELPGEGQRSRPCVEMTHGTRNFKTMIAFSADPRQRPEVFVDTGAEVMQFQPAWLNGGWAGLAWFTLIVLEVEREMADRHGAGNDTETPEGGRSALPEVSTPGPLMGDNHGKFQATE